MAVPPPPPGPTGKVLGSGCRGGQRPRASRSLPIFVPAVLHTQKKVIISMYIVSKQVLNFRKSREVARAARSSFLSQFASRRKWRACWQAKHSFLKDETGLNEIRNVLAKKNVRLFDWKPYLLKQPRQRPSIKKGGFMSKTKALHVHHAFQYISLTSTARLRRETS